MVVGEASEGGAQRSDSAGCSLCAEAIGAENNKNTDTKVKVARPTSD